MAPSKPKITPLLARAALTTMNTSVRAVAHEEGCSDKTLYAVLNGARPGKDPKVRKAIARISRITAEVFHA